MQNIKQLEKNSYMKFFLLILILNLVFISSGNSQQIYFTDYSCIHGDSDYSNIHQIMNVQKGKTEMDKFFYNNFLLDEKLYHYFDYYLNNKYNIVYKQPNMSVRIYSCKDSLFILKSKYCIQDLINDTSCGSPYVENVYEFTNKFTSDTYLMVYICDFSNREYKREWYIIFKIENDRAVCVQFSNEKKDKSIYSIASSTENIGYFDGVNLYVCYLKGTKIDVYKIVGKNLILISDKYVLLKKARNDIYEIDLKNSKWFFKINGSIIPSKFHYLHRNLKLYN